MLYIKANNEITKVYQRIIMSMKERVEWNGDIIIRKNTMILAGRVRSMYFELATRRVYSDIEELEFDSANAFDMGNNKLITNIINMLLYPFGKWGAIKGLNVDKDYMVLAALFSQIFKEIDVETYFTKTSLKFFISGIQITFEDAMEKCIAYIQKQREIQLGTQNVKEKKEDLKNNKNTEESSKEISAESTENKVTVPEKRAGETRRVVTSYLNKTGENKRKTDEGSAESSVRYGDDKIEDNKENKTGAGLWHNMKWSIGHFEFKREKVDQKYANSHRIGNNFYVVPYECPDCSEHLHMVVYPQRKENVIDTDEGRVYITRAYTCDNCKKFYTAKPGKLLREGDAYVLDFDNDEYAARDYVQLLGKKGAKTGNCNFNMYEADYEKGVSSVGKRLSERCRKMELLTDEELEQILAQMDDGFFSDYEKERFLAIIEQELEYREKMRNKKFGEFGRRSDEREEDEEQEDTKQAENAMYESEALLTDDKNMSELDEMQPDEEDTDRKEEYSSNGEANSDKSRKKLLTFGKGSDSLEKTAQQDREQKNKKGSFFNKFKKDNGKNSISKNINPAADSEKDKEQISADTDIENVKNDNTEEIKTDLAEQKTDISQEISTQDIEEISTEDRVKIRERTKTDKSSDNVGTDSGQGTEERREEDNNTSREENKKTEKNDDISTAGSVSFFDRITEESRTAKYSDIVENIKKIKASKGDEQEKAHYIDVMTKLCKMAAKREIEYLIAHLPGNINFERYKRTKEKLMSYTEIDFEPYIKIVDAKRDKVEFDELNKIVSNVDRENRNELLETMEKIKNGEYEKRNSDRFVEGLRKRVYAMDESKLRGICPDPDDITFDEGIKALKEIEGGVFLPELKSNMVQLIDKKLTTLKTEECELLVRKLERDLDGKISDMSKIHFYDIRKMKDSENSDKETSFVKVAVSTYAYATGKYEYPIVICDSSMFGSGKEGFIITPDHIFYKGLIKSGAIDVKNIDGISSEKKGLMIDHSEKGNVKIPCTLNKNDEKSMAEVLDSFIDYLKLKPESRSVEYMSKNEHKVKCCYRCGHVFMQGDICPKCGSRFEQ